MTARDKFNGIEADYWDCRNDADCLSNTEVAEAVEDYVDGVLSPMRDTEGDIRKSFPAGITIWPWVRKVVTDAMCEDIADSLIERAAEDFSELLELGNPEDGDSDGFTQAVCKKHIPAFAAAVKALYADATVWGCERGKGVELTLDELLEYCRAEFPHWFEKEPAE